MTAKTLAGLVCSLMVMGCGGGGGGGDGGGGGGSCADLFTTPTTYNGQEDVAGCATYNNVAVTAVVSQTSGSCTAEFDFHTSSATHTCPATLSGDASSGYDLSFTCTGDGYTGKVHFPADLSTYAGSFTYTVSATCSGTTTFKNMAKAP